MRIDEDESNDTLNCGEEEEDHEEDKDGDDDSNDRHR